MNFATYPSLPQSDGVVFCGGFVVLFCFVFACKFLFCCFQGVFLSVACSCLIRILSFVAYFAVDAVELLCGAVSSLEVVAI